MAEFKDERGRLVKFIDYLLDNISSSEFEGAHNDIDKLIANADKEHELAQLFKLRKGNLNIGVYRHLDQGDSTVNMLMGLIDQYGRPEGVGGSRMSVDDALYRDVDRNVDNPNRKLSQTEAARYLAMLRNQ